MLVVRLEAPQLNQGKICLARKAQQPSRVFPAVLRSSVPKARSRSAHGASCAVTAVRLPRSLQTAGCCCARSVDTNPIRQWSVRRCAWLWGMVTGETSCRSCGVNTGTVWAAVQLVKRPELGPARSGPGKVGRGNRTATPAAGPCDHAARRPRSAAGGGRGYRIEPARCGACDQTTKDRAAAVDGQAWRGPAGMVAAIRDRGGSTVTNVTSGRMRAREGAAATPGCYHYSPPLSGPGCLTGVWTFGDLALDFSCAVAWSISYGIAWMNPTSSTASFLSAPSGDC
jgi:hypothetical protein